MGYSSWSSDAYRSVSAKRSKTSSREIFSGTGAIDPLMDPKGIKAREARDSEHHPASIPIIVAFDVTGSMGDIPTRFAKDLLGSLMTMLVERGYVTDPQVLFAAVGDAESDRAPLQVGQFESGLEMDMWLTRLWLEGRGGDSPESYLLPHWFAANHTDTDAWNDRRKKGYLFSIGDAANKPLTAAHVERVFGTGPDSPTSDTAIVAAAAERWEVFHILVTRGREAPDELVKHWRELVGDGLLVLDETNAICVLMGVVMGLREGKLSEDDAFGALQDAGMGTSVAAAIVGPLTAR